VLVHLASLSLFIAAKDMPPSRLMRPLAILTTDSKIFSAAALAGISSATQLASGNRPLPPHFVQRGG
jgi:hypothetical protein